MFSLGMPWVVSLAFIVGLSQLGVFLLLPGSLPAPPPAGACLLRVTAPSPPPATDALTTSAPQKTTLAPTLSPTEAPKAETESPPSVLLEKKEFTFFQMDKSYTIFGTVSNFSEVGPLRTEAVCECYDESCTLHVANVQFKVIAEGVVLLRTTTGKTPELMSVLRRCRNNFKFCDPLPRLQREATVMFHWSVLCDPGLTYRVSSRTLRIPQNQETLQSAGHVLLTARAIGWQFYHGIVYPRGILLNWAIRELALELICGHRNITNCTKSKMLLFSDARLLSDAQRQEKTHKFDAVEAVQSLLGVHTDPKYLQKNVELSARWLTMANRILRLDGRLLRKIGDGVEIVRASVQGPSTRQDRGSSDGSADQLNDTSTATINSTSESSVPLEDGANISDGSTREGSGSAGEKPVEPRPAAAPDPAADVLEHPLREIDESFSGLRGSGTAMLFTNRKRIEDRLRPRGIDKRKMQQLLSGLPQATGLSVDLVGASSLKAFSRLSFHRQLSIISNYSFFFTDEGAQLTWMVFSNPGSTWVTIYEYRPGRFTNNIRFHFVTWLIRRNCRFLAYLIEDDKEAGLTVLYEELRRPYANEIVYITPRGVQRCDSLEACANRIMPSLYVDYRAAYPFGI
jgi:hypothetical protein